MARVYSVDWSTELTVYRSRSGCLASAVDVLDWIEDDCSAEKSPVGATNYRSAGLGSRLAAVVAGTCHLVGL